ncbi:MAG: EpsI family protein, partial [Phycisphaerae bacterium]|nr:EpsI family protein [Phycisphaerae bacterium]
ALVGSGLVYRHYAEKWHRLLAVPVKLPRPLAEFPMQVGDWQGQDVEMSEAVKKIAGNDDYISRQYVNSRTGQSVYLYVAFSGRPRNMRGHRPQVCYKGAGWNNTESVPVTVELADGRQMEAMMHRFNRIVPSKQMVSVLNYYVVNGQVTLTEEVFTGLGFRTPNLKGNLARYVTQVQISGEQESGILAGAREICGLLESHFPRGD